MTVLDNDLVNTIQAERRAQASGERKENVKPKGAAEMFRRYTHSATQPCSRGFMLGSDAIIA